MVSVPTALATQVKSVSLLLRSYPLHHTTTFFLFAFNLQIFFQFKFDFPNFHETPMSCFFSLFKYLFAAL
ncbi:hypothetical protein L2E82_12176 [Cichorium intybus]|uniref:Uncharacterized protein n=1 Tax=Cichorium intybus TaxID=13427 RepID=A0ACB9GG31_CICIN|nr:hypothetical protein L2E82_12176 [Cichorium intybus]